MRNGSKKAERKLPRIEREGVELGSGNVFADLGLPEPDLALARAQLVQHIRHVLEQNKLSPARTATILGIDKDKVAALLRGRVQGYSLDRLVKYLNLLGQRVEIMVGPATSSASTTVVVE